MTRFISGDRTEEAMKALEIDSQPFDNALLKKHFSICLNKFHPDKNNGDGDLEKTRQAIEAYNWLRNLTIDCLSPRSDKPLNVKKSDDMFSLWENCEVCNGTGKERMYAFQTRCSACEGRGYFVKRYGWNDRFEKKVVCKTCNGKRFNIKELFRDCYRCGGLGEYELHPDNPVIPKGAILF